MRAAAPARTAAQQQSATPGLRILSVELPVLVQDMGRPGLASMGVSISGALDRGALAAANAAVGNPASAAALEITLGGLGFEAERAMTIALTGAPAPMTLRTADEHTIVMPHGKPARLSEGEDQPRGTDSRHAELSRGRGRP